MPKKIYLLTKDEAELVEHRRRFKREYIKEHSDANLIKRTEYDEHTMTKIRESWAKGIKVVPPDFVSNSRTPIDDIIWWIKKKFCMGVI